MATINPDYMDRTNCSIQRTSLPTFWSGTLIISSCALLNTAAASNYRLYLSRVGWLVIKAAKLWKVHERPHADRISARRTAEKGENIILLLGRRLNVEINAISKPLLAYSTNRATANRLSCAAHVYTPFSPACPATISSDMAPSK